MAVARKNFFNREDHYESRRRKTYQLILLLCAGCFNLILSMEPMDLSCPPCKTVHRDDQALIQQHTQEALSPKTITKRAWSAAYNGDYATAKELLHQAAQSGDHFSCAYLIQAYQQGNLITGTNQQEAEQLKALLARHLQEKKSEFFIDSSGRNFLVDWKINRKNEYLLGQDYARKNDWYQRLEKSLKATEKTRHCWKSTQKTFRFPSPQTGLAQLIPLFVDGSMDAEQVPLLVQGLKELNAPEPYDKILELLNRDFIPIEDSKENFLLGLVSDWAIAHNRQKELGNVYAKRMDDAWEEAFFNHGDKDKTRVALNKVLKAIPAYYQIDPIKTLERLNRFIERQVERMGWAEMPDDMLLQFLLCTRQVSPTLFETHCASILSKNLAKILVIALAHQETMTAFEGSVLAIGNLIDRTFEQALNKEMSPRAFAYFLSEGTAFHATYQDRIIAILPLYLKLWPLNSRETISLLKSPIQSLRKAAFQSLTEYTTAPENNEWECTILHLLGDIFSCDLSGIIGDGSAFDAYHYFYQACRKNNCIFGLQLLWNHMAKSDDERTKLFVQFMIKEFFNFPGAQSSADSFDTSLNNALIAALAENRIPLSLLSTFVKHAVYTSLSEHVSPSFLEEFNSLRLLQEEHRSKSAANA